MRPPRIRPLRLVRASALACLALAGAACSSIQIRTGVDIDAPPEEVYAILTDFEAYPDCDSVLPALGYTEEQRKDLEKTIAAVPCDAVVVGSACELANVISISQPVAQVTYGIAEDSEEGKPSPLMRALQDY